MTSSMNRSLAATAYLNIFPPDLQAQPSLHVLRANSAFEELFPTEPLTQELTCALLPELWDLAPYSTSVVEVNIEGRQQAVYLSKLREDLAALTVFRDGLPLALSSLEESSPEEAAAHLIRMQEQVSPYTGEHSNRMNKLAGGFGAFCGMDTDMIRTLQLLTELHDIGKLFIGTAILEKPTRLDEEERLEIENHALYGYLLTYPIPALRNIAPIILTHHERWDGNGYPVGLAGEKIPPLARAVSLLDAYDAMVNDRPYRKALPVSVALQEVKSNLNSQFDPVLGNLFLQFIHASM